MVRLQRSPLGLLLILYPRFLNIGVSIVVLSNYKMQNLKYSIKNRPAIDGGKVLLLKY